MTVEKARSILKKALFYTFTSDFIQNNKYFNKTLVQHKYC